MHYLQHDKSPVQDLYLPLQWALRTCPAGARPVAQARHRMHTLSAVGLVTGPPVAPFKRLRAWPVSSSGSGVLGDRRGPPASSVLSAWQPEAHASLLGHSMGAAFVTQARMPDTSWAGLDRVHCLEALAGPVQRCHWPCTFGACSCLLKLALHTG